MAQSETDSNDCFSLLCDETMDSFSDDPQLDALPDLSDVSSPAPLVRLPLVTEEVFQVMLGKQSHYSPHQDYAFKLRHGYVNMNSRRDAFQWLAEAHALLCFKPLSLCLAMNYLDRYLSLADLPIVDSAMQQLAVACLSIAVKMDEVILPPVEALQVADPKHLFNANTIEKMGIRVLTTLNWKMSAITPFSFLDYFICKLTGANIVSLDLINKAFQLILCAAKGIDFMEYKPSEIAAGVAIAVVEEIQETVDIDKATSENVDKERVAECAELVKDVGGEILINNGFMALPESPVAVLGAKCFSIARNDIPAGSQFADSTTGNNNGGGSF